MQHNTITDSDTAYRIIPKAAFLISLTLPGITTVVTLK
jgi:hypothetical protein